MSKSLERHLLSPTGSSSSSVLGKRAGSQEEEEDREEERQEDGEQGQPVHQPNDQQRSTSARLPRRRGKDAKPVEQLCLRTGRVLRRYARQAEVCASMQVPRAYVSECCRGLRSDLAGFGWRFAPEEEQDAGEVAWTPVAELLAIRNLECNRANFGVRLKRDDVRLDERDEVRLDERDEVRLVEDDVRLVKRENIGVGKRREDVGVEGGRSRPRTRKQAVEQLCMRTGRVLRRYQSQMSAAAAMNLNQVHVSMACRGTRKEAGGFGWRGCESDVEVDLRDPGYLSLAELLALRGSFTARAERFRDAVVEQRRLGEVVRRYANLAAAGLLSGASPRALLRCLRGEVASVCGFEWTVYEGPPLDLEADNAGRPSLAELGEQVRVHKRAASALRRERQLLARLSGEGEGEGEIEELDERALGMEQLCVASGAVLRRFDNAGEAAAALGVAAEALCECAHGARSEAHGFGWRFADDLPQPEEQAADEE